MATRCALLLFDGCDLLDVGGPYEVLLTADRLLARQDRPERLEVVTVTADGAPITAYGGLVLGPTVAADDLDDLDVLVVPGTVDVDGALDDAGLVSLVARLAQRARLVASVCTGSFLLAAAGLLRGRPATTHHKDAGLLARREDVGAVRTGVRWVDDGDLVTGAGLSSGLALGLHLVERLVDRDLAAATAAQIEHPWDPTGAA